MGGKYIGFTLQMRIFIGIFNVCGSVVKKILRSVILGC